MKLKWLITVVVLLTSSVVHANCMRETFGDTICGQGPCSNDRNGKVFCAAERDVGTGHALAIRRLYVH